MSKTLSRLFQHSNLKYYNYLLVFLITLFIFRPFQDSGYLYLGIWQFFLAIVFLSAVFNIDQHRSVQMAALVLSIPSIFFTWMNLIFDKRPFFIAETSLTVLFMLVCAGAIVYNVVVKARVTLETLKGVICAYFMVAFAFAFIYYLIDYLFPYSFAFQKEDLSIFNFSHFISEMLYFSFITLLTIGYGDIAPITTPAQTAAVIEGTIGQFYVAILVARIVSVYTLSSDKRMLTTIEKDLGQYNKRKKSKKT